MDIRVARFVAIAVVVVVLGGLMLSGRAQRLERRLASRLPVLDTNAGPPDSARAVALAVYAYRAHHAARGEAAVPVRVAMFSADSAGFVLELTPRDAGPGMRALVRVPHSGQVELRRILP